MTTRSATYKYIGFFDLVCDASFAYFGSKASEDHYEENRYARTSVLSTALCVESFANCLLVSLNLPRRAFSDLDRLPILSKIDTYLRISSLEVLDWSRAEVQKVSELVRARNDFVHDKTSRVQSDLAPAVLQSVDMPRWDITLRPDSHQNLGIFKLAFAWGADDALQCLRAVSSFLEYVLSHHEKVGADSVRRSLVSEIGIEDVSTSAMFGPYRSELGRLLDVGVDFTILLDEGI